MVNSRSASVPADCCGMVSLSGVGLASRQAHLEDLIFTYPHGILRGVTWVVIAIKRQDSDGQMRKVGLPWLRRRMYPALSHLTNAGGSDERVGLVDPETPTGIPLAATLRFRPGLCANVTSCEHSDNSRG